MAIRFAGTLMTIPTGAGTAITHGITNPTGTAAAPTEWHWNHGADPILTGTVYRKGAPTTTAITLAACTAAWAPRRAVAP